MRSRRGALSFHSKRDKFCTRSFFFCFEQNFASGEIRFRQIDKKTKSGLERILFGRKIGAVERITHFQTQSVARTEPAGPNS